jgi:hypothetical protein
MAFVCYKYSSAHLTHADIQHKQQMFLRYARNTRVNYRNVAHRLSSLIFL